MSSQVYYRKWRPQNLADVVGQEQVTQTLLNALTTGRISHAYLFCGPRGTGKTSTARILAKGVNCLTNGKGEPCNTCSMCQATTEGRALDVIEIDAASNRGIDEIRDLREKVHYAPNQARYKVYIIDEVHMLTKEASNALLKTLEEPPSHVIFILATTEAHKILPTVLSRCQRFDFRRISQTDVVSKLASIADAEGIQVEPQALPLIARSTTGSLRDAENLLEQLTTYYGSKIELSQVQAILGITGDWRAKELVKHVINNDISAGIATLNTVNNDGLDLRQFNRELVEFLRGLMLIKTGSDAAVDLTTEEIAELKDLAATTSLSHILKAVKLFGQLELGFDNYSTLPLELALADCILPLEEEKESPTKKAESEVLQPTRAATPPVVSPKRPAAEPDLTVKPKPVVEPETTIKPESTVEPEPAVEPAVTAKAEITESPTSPPSTTKGAPTTPPEPGSEIERLRLNWKQVVNEAPPDIKKTNAIALLRSAGIKPIAIEDDTVVLSFRYKIHKENVEKPENQQVAEKIISGFLGRVCRVRCIHEPENNHLVREVQKMGAQITSVEEK